MKKIFSAIFVLLLLTACGSENSIIPEAKAREESAVTIESGTGAALGCSTSSGGICATAVSSGFVSSGETIPLPAGFTRAQCTYMVGLSQVSGNTISTQINVDAATGNVTCTQTQLQEDTPNPIATTSTCAGSYIIVCLAQS